MDLNQLRMFAAVAELGNLTQAAERLHLSQPAASSQIKSLEEEFGVALFERKPSGLTLTRSGNSLLPMVQRLLAEASDILTEAKRFSGRLTGPIKLASVAAALDKSFLHLGKMLTLIMSQHPDLNVEVFQRSSRDVWTGVEEGSFDAGLAFGNKDLPNVIRIPLQEVPYRIVAPGSWDKGVCEASWTELASMPWVTCHKGGRHHDMAVELFKRFDCQPEKVVHGDSEQVITGLVLDGVGLGLMRERPALDANACGLVHIIGEAGTSTQFQVIYRRSRANDPAIRAILDVLSVCERPSNLNLGRITRLAERSTV